MSNARELDILWSFIQVNGSGIERKENVKDLNSDETFEEERNIFGGCVVLVDQNEDNVSFEFKHGQEHHDR